MLNARSLFVAMCCLAVAIALGGCNRDAGNPAPPRVDEQAKLPIQTSTIVVPLTVDLAMIERQLNQITPQRLWSINQFEPKCVPAQRVTVCAVHARKCKGDACRNVPCKIGFKRTKVTPDISCRIVGQVTRGRISLGGSKGAITVNMPVRAEVSARDVGDIIKRETATGAANVRAVVRMSIGANWTPVAKVDLAYGWTDPPGIDFLGQRIRFARRADAELKGVIAGLERDLSREIGKAQTRALVEGAWRKGFTSILLNRERPPAWMRITPQRLGVGDYMVRNGRLELTLAAETITETFIGDRPPDPEIAPLPPPSRVSGERGLRFHIPVLADYAQLEPVVERALVKLAAKGIDLEGIGPVKVEFGKVTIYATEGGRIAVGIRASADVLRSPLAPTQGEVWLSAIPYNDANSRVVRVRDLRIDGRTDREAVNLLFSLFADEAVLEEIRTALTQDFTKDYNKVLQAAEKAIAMRREGDFTLSARIGSVSHGTIVATGQGLFLPVAVTGDARIAYTPGR